MGKAGGSVVDAMTATISVDLISAGCVAASATLGICDKTVVGSALEGAAGTGAAIGVTTAAGAGALGATVKLQSPSCCILG